MTTENFYKIAAFLQGLLAVVMAYILHMGSPADVIESVAATAVPEIYRPGIWDSDWTDILRHNSYSYILLLLFSAGINAVIARSGIPIGLFRLLIYINLAAAVLLFAIQFLYGTLTGVVGQGLIMLSFLMATLVKPEFK